MSLNRQPQLFSADAVSAEASLDDLFAAWWRQYPRKVDKGAARKAFKRVIAKKIATFDELMTGVMRYSAERAGEDAKFTKHPATWLNAESWGNEVYIAPSKPLSAADSAIEGILEGIERYERNNSYGSAGPFTQRPRSRADTTADGILTGMAEHEFKISRGAAESAGLRTPRRDDDFDF